MKQFGYILALIFSALFFMGCSNKKSDKSLKTKDTLSKKLPVFDKQIGDLYGGGILVYQNDGKGLVVCSEDLGLEDQKEAKRICDELILNGYDDWHLPDIYELRLIYKNLKIHQLGGLFGEGYWSSTLTERNRPYLIMFKSGVEGTNDFFARYYFRAVRNFNLKEPKSIESKVEKTATEFFRVNKHRAYFHNRPDFISRKNSFLIEGDHGSVIESQNGFIYIVFENSKNVITKGWLDINDIDLGEYNYENTTPK